MPAINFTAGSIPMWGTFILLVSTIVGLWLRNKRLNIDSEGGIRDHYAKEVAALRAQVTAVQTAADLQLANAEKRYEEAIKAGDRRHSLCEEECGRLRDKVSLFERRYEALHAASLRLFAPRESLPQEVKDWLKSFEQSGIWLPAMGDDPPP